MVPEPPAGVQTAVWKKKHSSMHRRERVYVKVLKRRGMRHAKSLKQECRTKFKDARSGMLLSVAEGGCAA